MTPSPARFTPCTVVNVTDDISPRIKKTRQFQQEWCAMLGLPAPKPWTVEDEARFDAWMADGDRQAEEIYGLRNRAAQ